MSSVSKASWQGVIDTGVPAGLMVLRHAMSPLSRARPHREADWHRRYIDAGCEWDYACRKCSVAMFFSFVRAQLRRRQVSRGILFSISA